MLFYYYYFFFQSNIPSDDSRIFDPSTQILTVTEEQLLFCQKVPMGAPLDHDLMMSVNLYQLNLLLTLKIHN